MNKKSMINYQTLTSTEKKEFIVEYLKSDLDEASWIYKQAIKIRENECKKYVYIRAIIDVSNYCVCSCKFCGNSIQIKNTKKYCLNKEEIINAAREAQKFGIDMIHLASGENPNFNYNVLIEAISEIISMGLNCEIACGVLPFDVLVKLKQVGLERIILKFETSNNEIYDIYKTCHRTLNDTIRYIKNLKNMGFKVGSGNIVGFHNQSYFDLANDLLLLDRLNVNMASTSCLQANKEQPDELREVGDPILTLKFLSLMRLIMINKKLCIPTNSTLGKYGKIKALKLGANEISINFTPKKYAGNYSIYTGAKRHKSNYNETINIIREAGMELTTYNNMKEKGLVW